MSTLAPGSSDLVTVGESLILLAAPGPPGPLAAAHALDMSVGGAESNVAIGVRRLGWRSTWLGRVGTDALGDIVIATLRGQDVVVHATRDRSPTSLMIKERRLAAMSRVLYYRSNGPGSHLSTDDIDMDLLRKARVLHITGITPALSDRAYATIRNAVLTARAADVTVSFDVNYRASLWDSQDAARAVLGDLASLSDLVFAGDDEAQLLGAYGTPQEQAQHLLGLGAKVAIIKLGERGAVARSAEECLEAPVFRVEVADPVGAGDAFVAGFLSGWLGKKSLSSCLETASRCGALVVATSGDWEGLPRPSELELLSAPSGTVDR